MYKSNLIAENTITISDVSMVKVKIKLPSHFFPNSHGCRPNIPKCCSLLESIEIYRSIGTKLVKR